jgi:hypothetical protein
LKSRTKVIIPYPVVRNLLVQKELGEKRAHWMTTLQEYDLEIKPTQIVKGQGICKLVVDSVNRPDDDDIFYQMNNFLMKMKFHVHNLFQIPGMLILNFI